MKNSLIIIICALYTSCTIESTPGEIAVIENESPRSENLMKNSDCRRINALDDEINDYKKRTKNIRYSLLSVSYNQLTKSGFIMKETEVEISSFQENNKVKFKFGIGGNIKKNSSSLILENYKKGLKS